MWHTVLLGAVAGFTIYLGLPVVRLKRKPSGVQSLLNALALGVLIFLVWEILSKALEPVDGALKDGMKSGHWGPFTSLALMLVVGMVIGLVGLVAFHDTAPAAIADAGAAPHPTGADDRHRVGVAQFF